MEYTYCGNSGLQLPRISLGLWHNFGGIDDFNEAKNMIFHAFEKGVTHFDLANIYGPPPGSAESNFGKILNKELKTHRDEMTIASKAGHAMWEGPYGDGGTRKHLMASIDQSLKRTGLDYFDVFYSHRYDPNTPLEETMQALIDIVRQGKALHIGISKYPPEKAAKAYEILASQQVPCLIHQHKFNLLFTKPENTLFPVNKEYGVGFIAFSPLAQGILTDRYLQGIPNNSRAAKNHGFLRREEVTEELIAKVTQLNALALQRGQTLAEMSLGWVLNHQDVTSVIVGASSVGQLQCNLATLDNCHFTLEELTSIEKILT